MIDAVYPDCDNNSGFVAEQPYGDSWHTHPNLNASAPEVKQEAVVQRAIEGMMDKFPAAG